MAGHKQGAYFANPCYTQIHPTCIPVKGDYQSKLTLMSESLRNDGRDLGARRTPATTRSPDQIPEEERDFYLERRYPAFGNMVPRDIAVAAAKERWRCRLGVGDAHMARLSGLQTGHRRAGSRRRSRKYGNLFHMYQRITDENPYEVPMRIYPAVHYTMGGLWVDYDLKARSPACS